MAKINTVEAFMKASKIISETNDPIMLERINNILYRSLRHNDVSDNADYIYLTREEKKIFSAK